MCFPLKVVLLFARCDWEALLLSGEQQDTARTCNARILLRGRAEARRGLMCVSWGKLICGTHGCLVFALEALDLCLFLHLLLSQGSCLAETVTLDVSFRWYRNTHLV